MSKLTKSTNISADGKKTIEEKYKSMSQEQHILARPDTYVGDIQPQVENMFVFDDIHNKIIKKDISYVPGLYKIVDEILVNARDQSEVDKTCDTMMVSIDKQTGEISVYNNGRGIDVAIHAEHNIYVPEMIFGKLLTSTNYDDEEQRTTGGRNGYGAKLTNLFSSKFTVETVDFSRKIKFYQEFYDNMSRRSEPIIEKLKTCKTGYVKISFIPDFKKFKITSLNANMISLIKKRVYDLAGVSNKCKVYYNDVKIECKNFEQYINLYHFDGMAEREKEKEKDDDNENNSIDNNDIDTNEKDEAFKLFYEYVSDTWEVGFMYAPDNGNEQISFVNGICTYHGGTHVNYINDIVVNKLKELVLKKHKDVTIKPNQIKDNLIVFIKCTIINPAFTSQTKETLKTKVSEFGSKCEIKDKTLTTFSKSGILNQVVTLIKLKEQAVLKKSDGKKVTRISGIPKLEDANKAGSKESNKCKLILTEGDSAKALAMSGRSVVGSDYYGVFPLKGKLLNVREATAKQLLENEEICNIKKIMGLQHEKVYDELSTLRYGGIVLMTDQDSVTGDTPITLKNSRGEIEIKTIDSLCNENDYKCENNSTSNENIKIVSQKEYGLINDYQTWTDQGWTKINRIMRHKVSKTIYRIVTSSGCVDVTEDHSLLDENGNKITPNQCQVGTTLLHSKYNEKYNDYEIMNKYNVDYNNFKPIYCNNKLDAHKLYYLYETNNINVDIDYDDNDKYTLNLTIQDNPNQIKKIINLGVTEQYVYDLETENHHFQAGIGSMIVHNTDGYHIKGLLLNFIHYFWPSLLNISDFVTCLTTPIVKATKGKEVIEFYNIHDYETWKNEMLKGYSIKYYKGLGTSTAKEAKEYFTNIEHKLINYLDDKKVLGECFIKEDEQENDDECEEGEEGEEKQINIEVEPTININDTIVTINNTYIKQKYQDPCTEVITLAFERKRADDRKKWILQYDKSIILDNKQKKVPVGDFINKELIHFSNEDNNRSIPSMCDGLKPSQRKVLYGAIEKKLNSRSNEIRVAQLAGYVSEKTCYHHGEASLNGTIIGMAQNYVGSNNINLLYPSGQFGTKLTGGKDAASPRYIHTYLAELTKLIFRPEDSPILNYLNDDGIEIEPEFFIPIIPMVLVNGTEGIGTGFSTKLPCFNPLIVIDNILAMIKDEGVKGMIPWYKNFKGTISRIPDKPQNFMVYGCYDKVNDTHIRITELPIGTWTTDYKAYLDKLEINKVIKSYTSNNTEEIIDILVEFDEDILNKMINNDSLYTKLGLITKKSITNMHLYDETGNIKKYASPIEILEDFYNVRLDYYEKRKKYIIDKLTKELNILSYKMKFINDILNKVIIIERKRKQEIIDKLIELEYPQLADGDKNDSYDYLIGMPLYNLTLEKIAEFENKCKNKEQELINVKTTSLEDTWTTELNELKIAYIAWLEANKIKPVEIFVSKSSKTKSNSIKIVTKTKAKAKAKAKSASAVEI